MAIQSQYAEKDERSLLDLNKKAALDNTHIQKPTEVTSSANFLPRPKPPEKITHLSFWSDNWCGEKLNGPFPVDIKLTVKSGFEDLQALLSWIPHCHSKITQISLNAQEPDELICCLTKSGYFETKAYWNHIRQRNANNHWATRIWQKWLPLEFRSCLSTKCQNMSFVTDSDKFKSSQRVI